MVFGVEGDPLRCVTAGGGYRRGPVRGKVRLHEHVGGGTPIGAYQSSRVERQLYNVITIVFFLLGSAVLSRPFTITCAWFLWL